MSKRIKLVYDSIQTVLSQISDLSGEYGKEDQATILLVIEQLQSLVTSLFHSHKNCSTTNTEKIIKNSLNVITDLKDFHTIPMLQFTCEWLQELVKKPIINEKEWKYVHIKNNIRKTYFSLEKRKKNLQDQYAW